MLGGVGARILDVWTASDKTCLELSQVGQVLDVRGGCPGVRDTGKKGRDMVELWLALAVVDSRDKSFDRGLMPGGAPKGGTRR